MEIVCGQCGQRFTAHRPEARFCSVRCRVAAHRASAAPRPKPAVTPVTADLEARDRRIAELEKRIAELTRVSAAPLNELNVDPETLGSSAKAKLEVAKRMMERELRAEHAARMRGLEEEIRLRVIEEGKEYVESRKAAEAEAWADQKHWREMINNHKPPFTKDQFKTILMCLHPDGERTAAKLSEAFRLFNGKKLQLTGEK